jgi:hypothetical protein
MSRATVFCQTLCPHCGSDHVGAYYLSAERQFSGLTSFEDGLATSRAQLDFSPALALGGLIFLAAWLAGYLLFHWNGVWWQSPVAGLMLGTLVAGWKGNAIKAGVPRSAALHCYCFGCAYIFKSVQEPVGHFDYPLRGEG